MRTIEECEAMTDDELADAQHEVYLRFRLLDDEMLVIAQVQIQRIMAAEKEVAA